MIMEYIEAARARARYEIIDDEEPYYGEVPDLPGVWPPGKPWKNAGRILSGLLMAGSSFICGEIFLFPYLEISPSKRSFLWILWYDVLLIQ